MNDEKHYGPGIIQFITGYPRNPNPSEDDDIDGCIYDVFKQPTKHVDQHGGVHHVCGECMKTMPEHTENCPVHKLFEENQVKWEGVEYVRPPGMCPNCDKPKEGPHRFGCVSRGNGAYRTLPVTRAADGTFFVTPLIPK